MFVILQTELLPGEHDASVDPSSGWQPPRESTMLWHYRHPVEATSELRQNRHDSHMEQKDKELRPVQVGKRKD